ncbi:hypothetical protein NQ318_003100 [Aromia moschata]|uniref:tRNA (guanine(10)-N(2))-methyltransferase n=1 Tax=Aromia moschata TaxID=1265417 RepID=A0AAV8XWW4_9CUCU|nr:hypothetical protein NQ318_003100 [Aromia moschata]
MKREHSVHGHFPIIAAYHLHEVLSSPPQLTFSQLPLPICFLQENTFKFMMCKSWRTYLLWFAQEHIDFRYAEIESLLSLFNIEMKFSEKPSNEPYWIVEFASENDVKLLASRSVSLRNCIELWGHANNLQKLHEKLKFYPQNLIDQYFQPDKSFKIEVETFCKHFTQKEKVNKIETFSYLPVQGPVSLTNPDVTLQYIEYYGVVANNPPELPYMVFFWKMASGLRQLMKKLSLKTRKFIGNTSMDPQLSLLMANQAKIREKDESIKANMEQYKVEHKYVDVLVNDFSMPFWRDGVEFDAIITDPPYGIRESTERVGTVKENYTISEEHLSTHVPAKIEYGISSIYKDLLLFSAKHLRNGGRLVCWFPVYREDYDEGCLPSHSCMKLVANCEQGLSKVTSRRLLTFEKVRQPTTEELDMNHDNIMDFREKYFVLREETRKERRTQEAKIREENRLKHRKK